MPVIDWVSRLEAALPRLRSGGFEESQDAFMDLTADLETEFDFIMGAGAIAKQTAILLLKAKPAKAGGFFGLGMADDLPEGDPTVNAYRVLVAALNEDAAMMVAIARSMAWAPPDVAADFLAELVLGLARALQNPLVQTQCANPECPVHGTDAS